MANNSDEFYGDPPPWVDLSPGNEQVFHQGGLDQIDPAFDQVHGNLLAGAIGYDPVDLYAPSLETREDIERELPQWGPPFVKFVDERMTKVEKAVEKAIEKWSYQTQTIVNVASMQTTASGGVDQSTNDKAVIYEPPPGFTFALHRFSIVDIAHTLGTPYTAAASWWELRVNNDLLVGNSMISGQGQLPVFSSWGTRDAPRIRDGEIMSLFMSGGPVSTMLKIRFQGSLDRTIEG